MSYVLTGEYTLPSLGRVYGIEINPNIQLRAMTVAEEMRRLNSSDRPYKVLADIIDDCMITKPGISSYDMCMSDFQYLLHRLRVVTYGSDYKINCTCPYCKFENQGEISLNDMEVSSYTDDMESYFTVTLPISKNVVKLRLQTPRIADDISARVKEITSKRKTASNGSAFLLNIESVIESVDGNKLDVIKKSDYVKGLSMQDVNYIVASIDRLNEAFGMDMMLDITCDLCGAEFHSPFRVTPEFFRPTVDLK